MPWCRPVIFRAFVFVWAAPSGMLSSCFQCFFDSYHSWVSVWEQNILVSESTDYGGLRWGWNNKELLLFFSPKN